MENNHRKFGDTTGKQKQYDSYEESISSGEEKEEEEEEEDMKLKMIALIEESFHLQKDN